MNILKILIVIVCLSWQTLYSQDFYVTGATFHIGNGTVIENGIIAVEDGKIKEVIDATTVKINFTDKKVVDAKGKHIYPGIIAPNTQIGLVEIDYVKPTKDFNEIGEYTPNIRSIIAYNTDSEVEKTILSNGILYAQVVPQGGVISGSSSVVKLDAWNWEDAAIRTDDGVHVWWPSRFTQTGWWANPGKLQENENYRKTLEEMKAFLLEAKAYHEKTAIKNLKFDALKPVFEGEQNFYVHANGAKEMLAAIFLAEELDIKTLVFVGGGEAMQIADILKERDIPIIVKSIHSLPTQKQNAIDEAYKLPAQLQKEGIRYCLSYKNAWEQRSLMFLAGTASAYGLTKEEALAAITSYSAEILGLDDVGSLEPGKMASFIVSEGDILDMRTSIVVQAFIDGEEISLMDKQKELYQKYMKKYKTEGKL